MKKVLVFGGMILLLAGCAVDDPNRDAVVDQFYADLEFIDQWLAENQIDALVDDTTGLRYIIHELGTGARPDARSSNVRVNYEGRLIPDNTVFDSGEDVVFSLFELILGWKLGLPLIREGGSITLYIPSGYAYGPGGAGATIPPNSNLVFDIDLLEVIDD